MRPKPSLGSLARSRRFQRALGTRLEALDHNLPAVLAEDAEALHRTRVASRRLREVLPVIDAGGDASPGSARRRGIRRLTRVLGGVRELDVALTLLAELVADDRPLQEAAARVRTLIQRDRAVRYAEMIRRLEQIKPAKLTRRLASLTESREAAGAAEQLTRLRSRVLGRSRRLARTIEEAGALYAFDRLHRVRIAVKKLRYALELVQDLTACRTARLVRKLKDTQDLLGRLHDLEMLAAYLRRARCLSPAGPEAVAPAPPSGGDLALARLLGDMEFETRRLHAQYLQRVDALTAVTTTCRMDICVRLAQATTTPAGRRPA